MVEKQEMHTLQVVLPVPIWHSFTYSSSREVQPGSRVLVPFGKRKLLGTTVKNAIQAPFSPADADYGRPSARGGAHSLRSKSNGRGVAGDRATFKIKEIIELVDSEAIFSPELQKLAEWMSSYYFCPLGEVYKAMLPASDSKSVTIKICLSEKGAQVIGDHDCVENRILTQIFQRRSQLNLKTFQSRLQEAIAHEQSLGFQSESKALVLQPEVKTEDQGLRSQSANTLKDVLQKWEKKLSRKGLIQRQSQSKISARAIQADTSEIPNLPSFAKENLPTLTPKQVEVVEKLWINMQGNASEKPLKPQLLFGVTGSGKTEVFFQIIQRIFEQESDAQILVMVPEISLTPQMTDRFSERFPNQVCVVHSSQSAQQRWSNWQAVRCGEKKILLGPRSAVFAQFKNLRLIVVDEEHDGSYKQNTSFAYHGRDVAVYRGYLQKVPVVLASATPSFETHRNADLGKYDWHHLPARATGRAMPSIEIIQALKSKTTLAHSEKQQSSSAGNETGAHRSVSSSQQVNEETIDPVVLTAMQEELTAGRQVMVLLNKRGYANYLLDLDSGQCVSCPKCSISLTLHQKNQWLRCHYCNYYVAFQDLGQLPQYRNHLPSFFPLGFGTQRLEESLIEALPDYKVARLDSDSTLKRGHLEDIFDKFRRGAIQVLIGTQMLAKGHDFEKVSLVVMLGSDNLLNFPDYRSGEKAYQLFSQAAGRAGRSKTHGRVLIQSQMPDHPILRHVQSGDYKEFYAYEMQRRKKLGYPPHTHMIAINYESAFKQDLAKLSLSLNSWIDEMSRLPQSIFQTLRILGPASPPIEKISGRFRRQILLIGNDRKSCHSGASQLLQVFSNNRQRIPLKVDVDPVDLM